MDRQTITQIYQYQMPDTARNGFNGVLFVNKGTVNALINQFPLSPGESIGWQLNANEIDTGDYRVDFPNGNAGASVWQINILYKTAL